MALFGLLKKQENAKQSISSNAEQKQHKNTEVEKVLNEYNGSSADELAYALIKRGLALQTKGQHDQVREFYKAAAETGSAEGQCYYAGICENWDKNTEESLKWYKLAAEQGNIKALCTVAEKYKSGKDVPKDEVEALKWYKTGAEQGSADAQYQAAALYYKFDGNDNKAEALKWFKAAGEQGVGYSATKAADMLYNGEGTDVNKEEALKYYNMAVENGNKDAKFKAAVMYLVGDGVRKNKTKAMKWLKESAQNDYKDAIEYLKENNLLFDLALQVYNDDGAEGKAMHKKPLQWLAEDAASICSGIRIYDNKIYRGKASKPLSYESLFDEYELAAEKGSDLACYRCYAMLNNKMGITENTEKEKYWADKCK